MALNFYKIARGLFLTPQSTAPSSPVDGDEYYDSVLAKFRFYENGSWKTLGSGGNAGINYIVGGDAETDTSGWAVYADAAGALPVDGTGGSANVTFTRSLTAPLRNTASFVLTKDAVNRQGQGTSYDFAIADADLASMVNISFEYLPSVNFVPSTGVNGSVSDAVVYIYDVTNSRLIQPTPYTLPGGNTLPSKFSATFQTASNSNNYRLIFHVATTNALAWTLKLDDVVVGPQLRLLGPALTDWQSFVPTGSWNTNVTYVGKWRRIGSEMEVRGTMSFTGASTAGNLIVNLPSGYSIDYSQLPSGPPLLTKPLGEMIIQDASGGVDLPSILTIADATSMVARYILNNDGTNRTVYYDLVTNSAPLAGMANGDVIEYWFKVPIAGWGSNTLMSADAETRVVAASYDGGSGTAGSGNRFIFGVNKNYDTHNAYNPTTGGYTCPVAGVYEISGTMLTTAGGNCSVYIGRNASLLGPIILRLTAAVQFGTFYGTVDCQAGDEIYIDTTAGAVAFNDGVINIARIAGPETIAASESVTAMWYGSVGFAMSTSFQVVKMSTMAFDSHGAYNASTGEYRVPVNGKYRVTATVNHTITPNTIAGLVLLGADCSTHGLSFNMDIKEHGQTSTSVTRNVGGSITFEALAGDIIRIGATLNDAPTSTGNVNTSDNSYICIEKVGNF